MIMNAVLGGKACCSLFRKIGANNKILSRASGLHLNQVSLNAPVREKLQNRDRDLIHPLSADHRVLCSWIA
jgi:hypothetical protein